eukprot:CAMPEP_0195519064 /NCGR_PEP_ID=MMETSP0794_2-20130614/14306_1 /TAXON_ID=515487 /ORGANISM="Stephanopyxis turris, Strain CCMP 815" /LENGTH=100 /DNA_ID=CAMNT_0040648157 /DNA_START=70 /DNA_END=372 /DNA_ORIENTATION=+
MPHCILLFQHTKNVNSRGWIEFEHENQAFEKITEMYELHLKKLNPDTVYLEYKLSNLFEYIDNMPDLALFAAVPGGNTYAPFGKKAIKQKVMKRIKSQVQ